MNGTASTPKCFAASSSMTRKNNCGGVRLVCMPYVRAFFDTFWSSESIRAKTYQNLIHLRIDRPGYSVRARQLADAQCLMLPIGQAGTPEVQSFTGRPANRRGAFRHGLRVRPVVAKPVWRDGGAVASLGYWPASHPVQKPPTLRPHSASCSRYACAGAAGCLRGRPPLRPFMLPAAPHHPRRTSSPSITYVPYRKSRISTSRSPSQRSSIT